jgi:hypothetical protein
MMEAIRRWVLGLVDEGMGEIRRPSCEAESGNFSATDPASAIQKWIMHGPQPDGHGKPSASFALSAKGNQEINEKFAYEVPREALRLFRIRRQLVWE